MEYFISACIIALIPAFIARSKGRSFLIWYLYGVILWIVALIHSLVIKPYDEVLAAQGQLIKCPYCAEYVKAEAAVCKYCRNELPVLSPSEKESQKEIAKSELKKKNKMPRGLIILLLICLVLFILVLVMSLYIYLRLT